eukprot:1154350-Pelagomonas_calceolata.AAC.4
MRVCMHLGMRVSGRCKALWVGDCMHLGMRVHVGVLHCSTGMRVYTYMLEFTGEKPRLHLCFLLRVRHVPGRLHGATPRRVTGLSCRRAAQFGSCVDEAEPARSLQGVHRGLRCCEWARHAIQHVCRHGWLQPRVVCSSGHAVCVCHVCCWGGLCFEEQYHVVEKDDDGDAAT